MGNIHFIRAASSAKIIKTIAKYHWHKHNIRILSPATKSSECLLDQKKKRPLQSLSASVSTSK